MSGLLAGKVWQSNLDGTLKPLAACLADIANDDGTSIHPSVAYIAWLLGKDERSVQRGLKSLRASGVIQAVRFAHGGRNNPTEYRLIEEKLPARSKWKKGVILSPFNKEKGDNPNGKGDISNPETVTPVSPDPSVDPSVDPSPVSPRQYKRETTRKFYIEELESLSVIDSDGRFRQGLKDLFPYLDTEKFYRKWWSSRFAKGGITRRAGMAATERQYKVNIEDYFRTCADNPTNGNSNGNGHHPPPVDLCDPDRPSWMAGQRK